MREKQKANHVGLPTEMADDTVLEGVDRMRLARLLQERQKRAQKSAPPKNEEQASQKRRKRTTTGFVTNERKLRPDEITFLRQTFGDSVDYAAVELHVNSIVAIGAERTVGNSIYLHDVDVVHSNLQFGLTDEGLQVLAHELTHVWQYQHHGAGYAVDALAAQLLFFNADGDREGAYDYQPQIDAGIPWGDWNPEQQARAAEHFTMALERKHRGAPAQGDDELITKLTPYMQELRAGRGAEARSILPPAISARLIRALEIEHLSIENPLGPSW